MKGRVFVKVERCVACKRCVLACAVEHSESKDLVGAMSEVPAPKSRVQVRMVEGAPVPTECRHCDAAACVAACPSGALFRGAGNSPVILLEKRCLGCGSCVLACPFGAIRQHLQDKQVSKCDLCVERLARGQQPACAEACPTGCLSYRGQEQMRSWLKKVGEAGLGAGTKEA